MAKINNNGQTVKENPTQKNSAKSTMNGISNILNIMNSDSMSPEAKKNAQTIASILALF